MQAHSSGNLSKSIVAAITKSPLNDHVSGSVTVASSPPVLVNGPTGETATSEAGGSFIIIVIVGGSIWFICVLCCLVFTGVRRRRQAIIGMLKRAVIDLDTDEDEETGEASPKVPPKDKENKLETDGETVLETEFPEMFAAAVSTRMMGNALMGCMTKRRGSTGSESSTESEFDL